MSIIEKVAILEIPISTLTLYETIEEFIDIIRNDNKKQICVLPVNSILYAGKNTYLRQIYLNSHLNLPDGMPLVWASKFLNKPIKERVTGLDIFPKFNVVCANYKFSIFLFGSSNDTLIRLSNSLKAISPQLNIVGFYSPPYCDRFSQEENTKIISQINNSKPDVLWVSLTAPKQDIWIFENLNLLHTKIAIGIGGAFEVAAGKISRSPVWMQKMGLEWFYRFLKEPSRLFKRYFIEAPLFIPLILSQICKIKRSNISG